MVRSLPVDANVGLNSRDGARFDAQASRQRLRREGLGFVFSAAGDQQPLERRNATRGRTGSSTRTRKSFGSSTGEMLPPPTHQRADLCSDDDSARLRNHSWNAAAAARPGARRSPRGPSGDPEAPGRPFPRRENEPANADQKQVGNRRLGDHRRARSSGSAGIDRTDRVRIIRHVRIPRWLGERPDRLAQRPDISFESGRLPATAPIGDGQIDQHRDVCLQRQD